MVNARSRSKEVYAIKGLVRWVERLDKRSATLVKGTIGTKTSRGACKTIQHTIFPFR
jgi:hypothetical protein